ncbi:MAG: GNAT family N-acetyltransferase [bacterium]|nr:GNAT family N-acetyltransferase [bacterium]
MELLELNSENWEECVSLHSKEDNFIASNLYSIAEAQFYDKAISRAIVVNGEMVGYVMFGEDEDKSDFFWIDRFMISGKFRRKKYGFEALNLLIDLAKSNPQYKKMGTSTHIKNLPMQSLLEKIGFYTKNEIKDDELIYYYDDI